MDLLGRQPGRRRRLRRLLATGFAAALLVGVVVTAVRVGDTARFVTWPVVGFTALAASAAMVGAWFGRLRPAQFVAGLLAALPLSYVLPVAPMPAVAVVLVCLGALATRAGAGAGGIAAGVGSLMLVLVVLQGPAVECGESSIRSNSGPWWMQSSGSSSGSGSATLDGEAHGTVHVGDRHYGYTCDGDRLTTFRAVG